MHGDYAKYIAQEYFHTLACVTTIGTIKLPTVELKKEKFEEILKSLVLVKFKRVELYSKKGVNWEVIRKVFYYLFALFMIVIVFLCLFFLSVVCPVNKPL